MRFLFAIPLLLTGCQSYVQTQLDLTDQAARAVTLCRDSGQQRRQLLERFFQVQRGQLDQAFEADVRQQPQLVAQWVLEHAQAYAAALDALAQQRQASAQAAAAEQRNFQAIEDCLRQLRRIQSSQLQLLKNSKVH